jgi:glycosyltransferase involved in cell wall biosynthesis
MRCVSGMNLVSIVIPCYNAGRWLREAIDSCLTQTYSNLEVIVVDDGSTDDSLSIARTYGSDIVVTTGPNRGESGARNKGFSLSHGDYIQFLDADDYLLPEKIERQVEYLETEGGDVVYGDWQIRFHLPDGSTRLGEIWTPGRYDDPVLAVLNGWNLIPLGMLHRREIVERVGGWDESLHITEDTAFLFSEIMTGADLRYQPGCFSVYRRYGNVTLSTADPARRLHYLGRSLGIMEKTLEARGLLQGPYREALAQFYYRHARAYYGIDPGAYRHWRERSLSLEPHLVPRGSMAYNLLRRCCGVAVAERLTYTKRSIESRIPRLRS